MCLVVVTDAFKCSTLKKMQEILLIIFVIVTGTVSHICDRDNSVELSNRTYNGVQYNNGEYFVDNATGIERGCICMKEICIRKCCPLGQGYNPKSKICIDVSEKFNPPVWEGFAEKAGFNAVTEFFLLFFKMKCLKENNEYRLPVGEFTKNFHLQTRSNGGDCRLVILTIMLFCIFMMDQSCWLIYYLSKRKDGKLYVKESIEKPNTEYSADKYCIDNFVREDDESKNTTIELNALVCYSPKVETNHYGVSASCMLISCFFIILTVAVYSLLPKFRTLNGIVMITHLLNFFVAFLFMATMQILTLMDNITPVYCVIMTFVIYFTVLAAFFWLNVMSYDLWSKLRCSKNMAHGFVTSATLRFLWYSAYAFGLPTALTILLAALEFSNLPADIKLLPHIRQQGCFLYGTSRLLYFYTPMLAACVANLILFILIARILVKMAKQAKIIRKSKDSQRFSLYIKMFIVTGFNWVLEVVSYFFPEADKVWQFTDGYNALVGFIIFVIFVCKKETLISLRQRLSLQK